MASLAGLGILIFLVMGQTRMAGGFAVGAGISILGYHWLAQAVKVALNAVEGAVPKRVLLSFLLRYPIAFGAVLIFYETHWLPFTGVLAGLFVPIAGTLAESLNLMRRLTRTEHHGA